ncbi:hypothetical protein BOTBODRAFT_182364 [Botryobasidium botryosum FD-172 SS1]|uniref:Uncharacterized protein n=1 Tax=Botryobasidium botryosum (strain FD-172 SS1) TaxID=930990 RepID=A0A067M195_BOTB1|nr:hypothetical protein BOTBODRAFT_182364 [Botryobasidium botryosum FD-172 SS1]
MAQVSTDDQPEPPVTTELSEDPTVTDLLIQGMELQNLQSYTRKLLKRKGEVPGVKALIKDQRWRIRAQLAAYEPWRAIHLPVTPLPPIVNMDSESTTPAATTAASATSALGLTPVTAPLPLPSTTDQPELYPVILPSSFSKTEQERHGMADLVCLERDLREKAASEALDLVRVAVKRRAHGISEKRSHKSTRGQQANTRMESRIKRLSTEVDKAADQYHVAYTALLALGMPTDHPVFKELLPEHLSVGSMIWGKDFLGAGRSRLPWIWLTPNVGGTPEDWSKEGCYGFNHGHISADGKRRLNL